MGSGQLCWIKAELKFLTSTIYQFKKIVVDTFSEHCSTDHFISMFHLVSLIDEDLHRFGKPSVLGSSPFDHHKVHISTRYRELQHE